VELGNQTKISTHKQTNKKTKNADPGFCQVILPRRRFRSKTKTKTKNKKFLIPDSATSSCHVTASDPRVVLVPKLVHYATKQMKLLMKVKSEL
jgi:hypothetical protein